MVQYNLSFREVEDRTAATFCHMCLHQCGGGRRPGILLKQGHEVAMVYVVNVLHEHMPYAEDVRQECPAMYRMPSSSYARLSGSRSYAGGPCSVSVRTAIQHPIREQVVHRNEWHRIVADGARSVRCRR